MPCNLLRHFWTFIWPPKLASYVNRKRGLDSHTGAVYTILLVLRGVRKLISWLVGAKFQKFEKFRFQRRNHKAVTFDLISIWKQKEKKVEEIQFRNTFKNSFIQILLEKYKNLILFTTLKIKGCLTQLLNE